jgi:hypothetical protein
MLLLPVTKQKEGMILLLARHNKQTQANPDATLPPVAEQQMPIVKAGILPQGAQRHTERLSSSQETVQLAKGRHVPLPEHK